MFNRNRNRGQGSNNNEPPKRYEIHGTTSDWVGTIVNIVLAGLTVYAIFLSKDAVTTANDTLSYAKKRDSINDKDRVIKDSGDSIKYSIDTAKTNASIRISNELAQSSIQSLKDFQRRFEIENESSLWVTVEIIHIDSPLRIVFKPFSIGKLPIIITGYFMRTHFNDCKYDEPLTLKIIDTLVNYVGRVRYDIQQSLPVSTTNEEKFDFPYPLNYTQKQIGDILSGNATLFLFGKFKYVNAINRLDTLEQRFVRRFVFTKILNETGKEQYNIGSELRHVKNYKLKK
jgi:hypothetical protein